MAADHVSDIDQPLVGSKNKDVYDINNFPNQGVDSSKARSVAKMPLGYEVLVTASLA